MEVDKPILKFKWKCKGFKIAKTILKKKMKFGRLILLDFKAFYKVTIMERVL